MKSVFRSIGIIISVSALGYFGLSNAAESHMEECIEESIEEYKEVICQYTDSRIDAMHTCIADIMKNYKQMQMFNICSNIPDPIKTSFDLLEMFYESPTCEIKQILREMRDTLCEMENIIETSEIEEICIEKIKYAHSVIRTIGEDICELIQFYIILDININRMQEFIMQGSLGYK
ncbi:hypothetical protein NEAUS03_1535 [Nematocida ausubeli]|nr:hypothetical protein NEAUS03_1535 [Nematocida ausubeli]